MQGSAAFGGVVGTGNISEMWLERGIFRKCGWNGVYLGDVVGMGIFRFIFGWNRVYFGNVVGTGYISEMWLERGIFWRCGWNGVYLCEVGYLTRPILY